MKDASKHATFVTSNLLRIPASDSCLLHQFLVNEVYHTRL